MAVINATKVHIHGVRVGELVRLNEDEDFVFTFDEAWLDDPDAPVLGQFFIDRRPRPIGASGMPCWFAHLLPNGPWRRYLQRWARLDADENDDFALLAAIGHDLPGAVTLEDATVTARGTTYALRDPVPEGAIRFSLAGAQWKLSIRRGERGLTVPTEDQHGFFIAKFEDPLHPGLPRIEYVTTEWGRLSGLAVHRASLLPLKSFDALPDGIPTEEKDFLCLERFDRTHGDERVHIEDFAQIIGCSPMGQRIYQGRYEQIAAVIASLCPEDFDEYLARLVFMIASGNGDAHLKNWSVIYPDRRRPRLSPAYDLVSTIVYRPTDELALELSGTRRFSDLSVGSFDGIARLFSRDSIAVRQRVTELWEQVVGVWRAERLNFDLRSHERERIDAHLASLRLSE